MPLLDPRMNAWGPTGTKPCLFRELDHILVLGNSNYQILAIYTPNSGPEVFPGDELGKNLIYRPIWPKAGLAGPF